MPPEPESAATVAVVRYPNRRLYDRTHNKYVTLQEIERLVREGRTVQVRDSRTEEDLTRSVLTQIILDRYPERMELFPIPILHMMIRANDMVLGFLRHYLQQSLAVLETLQTATPFNPFAAPIDWLKPLLPETAAPPKPAAEQTEQIGRLVQRIEELERRLQHLQGEGASEELR